jgi:hypothetical protein
MNGKNLKYFALGAAIVAAGLGAMAVTIPNTFSSGQVISAAGLNDNFTAVKTAVDALEAPNSVTTAKIADGAVNAAKIADEPGAAQATGNTCVTTTLASGAQSIRSATINAPAAGFILVIGSAQVNLAHTAGTASSVTVGVSTVATSLPTDQDKAIALPAASVTGTHAFAGAGQKIFPATAGANTFHLVAILGTGSASVADCALSLVYVPTSYGTVQQ